MVRVVCEVLVSYIMPFRNYCEQIPVEMIQDTILRLVYTYRYVTFLETACGCGCRVRAIKITCCRYNDSIAEETNKSYQVYRTSILLQRLLWPHRLLELHYCCCTPRVTLLILRPAVEHTTRTIYPSLYVRAPSRTMYRSP